MAVSNRACASRLSRSTRISWSCKLPDPKSGKVRFLAGLALGLALGFGLAAALRGGGHAPAEPAEPGVPIVREDALPGPVALRRDPSVAEEAAPAAAPAEAATRPPASSPAGELPWTVAAPPASERPTESSTATAASVERIEAENQAGLAAVPADITPAAALDGSAAIGGEAAPPMLRRSLSDGFVLLAGGAFTMGDTMGVGLKYERPSRAMEVVSFYLSPREVTRREWRELMGSPAPSFPDVGDDHPVEFITWYDALAFCNALSAARGLRPAYEIRGKSVLWDESADGYRLPTEAEWEFAARSHGVAAAEEARLYAVIDRPGPAPVASLKPNAAGLFDMIGNVAEWCWDVFLPYDEASPDYERAKLADERAVRGGSWYGASVSARPSARGSAHPLNRLRGVGLRLARNAGPR